MDPELEFLNKKKKVSTKLRAYANHEERKNVSHHDSENTFAVLPLLEFFFSSHF